MLTSTYNLSLRPGVKPLVVHVSQYDKGETLVFILTHTGTSASISSGVTAEIRGTKPDGNGFSYASPTVSYSYSEDVGTVTVTLTEQMTSVDGKVLCEIVLFKGSGSSQQQLGTANFILCVERAALDKDTVVSASEIRQLVNVIDRTDELIAAANSAQSAADTMSTLAFSINESAQVAVTTLDAVNEVAESIASLSIGTVTTLNPEDDATASITGGSSPVLNLGIPRGHIGGKGDKGDDGTIENLSVEAETLPAGSDASASYEGNTLTLGIPTGATGATGVGIASIAKTGSSGLIDTYTITYTNGTTSAFTVTNGEDGTNGVGVPTGGTAGQALVKASGTDYDTEWADAGSGVLSGGTTGQALVKASNADGDVEWGNMPIGIPSGGESTQVLSKNSGNNYDVGWKTVVGIPSGGASDMALVKTTASDYSVGWRNIKGIPSGGTAGQALVKSSGTDYDVAWENLLDIVYPVGSIYMSVNNVSPATFIGGTWTQIEGAWLVGAGVSDIGQTYSAGTTYSQQLPNIKGTIDNSSAGRYPVGSPSLTSFSGAFSADGTTQHYSGNYQETALNNLHFDAHSSNSVYTDNGVVRPTSLAVYMWKRTA